MTFVITEEQFLKHYGTPRKSGRYPWGSGGNVELESKRNRDFLDLIAWQRKEGMSDREIWEGMGLTSTQFRARQAIAGNQQAQEKINQAVRLKDTGMSNNAIAKEMGLPNESSVRSLLDPDRQARAQVLSNTAAVLKREVAAKTLLDVGSGTEYSLDISEDKLKKSLAMLQEEGYQVHKIDVIQLGTGKPTTRKVLAAPGTTWADVARNKGEIRLIDEWSETGGESHTRPKAPLSVDSKRVQVNFAEDGGTKADGVIYVRPGVDDISIGANQYAQVRILVDGTHYLKGMATYKTDLPPGVDLQFNTNKPRSVGKMKALKPVEVDSSGKVDPINPFGASIKRQIQDEHGRVTSSMNIIRDEGDWDGWTRALSSQILSKQSPELAKAQLDMTYERQRQAYDEIVALTNPAVKRKLLESFADNADAASVHLKAATLPGSAYHVIMPIQSIKPTEVYAPNFRDGTRLTLIRSPHGGTFEIPEVTVNNRNREGRKAFGTQPKDVVGIHPKVAERLSGADFDGDFVLAVPNDRGLIKTSPALEGLKDFDPKTSFPGYPGMKLIGNRKQLEMGKATNLIADMSIKGANNEELARAVRHSMVVIDAPKHDLDYQASFKQNGIAQLKAKYQGKSNAGASTLITKAGSEYRIPERRLGRVSEGGPINPKTGEKVWVPTGKQVAVRKPVKDPVSGKTTWVDTGQTKDKEVVTKRLAVETDAFKLSSGSDIEAVYAEYSNSMKALGNAARKAHLETKSIPYSPSAKAAYSNEVASLNAKLDNAKRNRPRERQAQTIAHTLVQQKKQANPEMDEDDMKKAKKQALDEARIRTGAKKDIIVISPREWQAIQAGAISNHGLEQILNNADLDVVKAHATPKQEILMTPTKANRAKNMAALGFTQAEIAQQLGVSLTTLKTSLNG